ncbi:diacylglycerol/lipid kinase family protein [Lujinxingia litoralis]|nr:diacylglycerol kinase family protein [Lujinxingia litoralis]
MTETSTHLRTFVIANPVAGAGQVKEDWPLLERLLRANLPEVDFAFTEGPAHATLLAREALRTGWEMVVAVGGDGTLNEVVNGFYERPEPTTCYALDDEGWVLRRDLSLQPINPDAVLGLVPIGTGGDFRRSVGLMAGAAEAIERLRGRETRALDLGQVGFLDARGNLATRYFVNIASGGISGVVDAMANSTWKGLGGRASFAVATMRAFAKWKNIEVEVRLDDTSELRDRVLNLSVANGEYFGGGMWVAPGAELDDGRLQLIMMGDLSRPQALRMFTDIYKGSHLGHRKVSRHRARQVAVRLVEPSALALVDLDGEQPGKLPATFNVHHRALQFKA